VARNDAGRSIVLYISSASLLPSIILSAAFGSFDQFNVVFPEEELYSLLIPSAMLLLRAIIGLKIGFYFPFNPDTII